MRFKIYAIFIVLIFGTSAARSDDFVIKQKNSQRFIVGTILNQGENTIFLDLSKSSNNFRNEKIPTSLDEFTSSSFKIEIPTSGFENDLLRYGRTDGGCIFFFNSDPINPEKVKMHSASYGDAKCSVRENTLLIKVECDFLCRH